MEELLLKLIENTPVLAVLAFFMLYSMKMQERRDIAMEEERKSFVAAFQRVSDALTQSTIESRAHSEFVQASMLGLARVHEYQNKEHEQMIKLLERLNGK